MTLSELRTEIRNITGVDETSVVSDAVLTDLINKGQSILADEANLFLAYGDTDTTANNSGYRMYDEGIYTTTIWSLRENGVAVGSGTSNSNLKNMIRIYRVDYDDNQVTRIGEDQIYNIEDEISDIHMPSSYGYFIRGSMLHLFPAPTEVKTIRVYYYAMPKVLSGDSDVPLLDSRYHECLIYYGAWKVMERLRDINMIPYFKNEWNEWKEKVVMDRQRRAGEPTFNIAYKDF